MKRVLIVGATSGIGFEMAKIFIEMGCVVGVVGRRIGLLEELRALAPEQVHTAQIDVTEVSAPHCMLELVHRMGGMDLFVLSSGIGSQNMSLDAGIELSTVQTNAMGFTRMVTCAFNYFAHHAETEGHIAAISSVAGTKGLGVAPAYSATKGFQSTYLEALTQQAYFRRLPVVISDIRPGFVETDLIKGRNYPMLMGVRPTAQKIVRQLLRRERCIIVDWRYRLLVFVWRLIPSRLWVRLPVR